MAGYFDQLSDVVPAETIKAMDLAVQRAIHGDGGRESESAVLAGVRALLERYVSREAHSAEVARLVQIQRSDSQFNQEALVRRVQEVRRECAEDLRRLARVRGLLDYRRKTLPMEKLREALDTPIG